jgi:hypothetical protein
MDIYKVEAFFEDFESSYSLIIGLFTDKKLAELVKNKWLDFFTQSKDLLSLDKELIFDHFKNSEIENLMKEFDRDFKLNKLLK